MLNRIPSRRHRLASFGSATIRVLAIWALVIGGLGGLLPFATASPALAQPEMQVATTNTIALRVASARTEPLALDGAGVAEGDPITTYEFLINEDNTGDPFDDQPGCDPFLADGVTRNPDYPENCNLPSIHTTPGWSPIYTQGDQAVLNETTTLTLPDGDYLISVTTDNFKIDGEHFTLPMEDLDGDGVAVIDVAMHPYPLPPASMVILVFEDNSLTNGQYDAPVEQGLEGFRVSLNDIAGEITTDIFGNPLCTIYEKDAEGNTLLDADGAPIIETRGRGCYSDANGIITIPNIGPMRYDVLLFPPAGEDWIQTTTLEGSHGWDTWLQEGGTGLDNEFLVASEPFPWTIFGFVKPTGYQPDFGGTGTITGEIWAASTWVPAQGGIPYVGRTFGGFMGTKLHRPITYPWLSLNDLQGGDTSIWVGQGNADGSFTIPNVPEGDYFLTYWDEVQHYILDFVQVTVTEGQVTDVGIRMLTGWFTEVYGTVFLDINENGKQDVGEPGIPDYLVVLKDRDNTEIDRMSIAQLTDVNGFYELEKGYPMGWWMILEAYSDLYRTTGVTYQTLNMPTEETLLGGIVDIGLLPILGQPVRLDWGVKRYTPMENGGIAGTVFYDTVRAEDEARYAGVEPWQPGIPDLTVNLYKAQIDAFGVPIKAPDGSYAKGQLLMATQTETFARPKGCIARNVDGEPIDFPPLPDPADNKDCLEGPMMGTQIGDGQNDLDGNWGFGDGCFGAGGYDPATGVCADGTDPTPLTPGQYLVEVVIPTDASGEPMLKVTREEDLNTFEGDVFLPQIPPPACAGALHIVDVADSGIDNHPAQTWTEGGVTINVPASTPTANPGYADFGGSRYEGQAMPLCDVKHVYLSNAKAVAPIFNLFTDVPIPGKWRGYIISDLAISVDPNTLFFGEMGGVPEVPIGFYDYAGNLVHTEHSDFNGVYEVIMPSTDTFNAPAPSGMFANVYYQYGNDPGPLDRPNLHYNPQYRSIGTSFEVYPGTIIPADLAPTHNGAAIWAPGAQFDTLALCQLADTAPQLYAVSKPYATGSEQITISGIGFGLPPAPGNGATVLLGIVNATIVSWTDRQIVFTVPTNVAYGPHQLLIRTADNQITVNGLTFHKLGTGYNPTLYEVGVGKTYDPTDPLYDGTASGPIQHAIDDAWAAGGRALVVVYPGEPVAAIGPLGTYFENLVIYAPVKLQGIGPGGLYPDAPPVLGSILDGRAVGGDSLYTEWWREVFLPDIWNNRGGWDRGLVDGDGNPRVFEGAVITVFGERAEFTLGYPPTIDGFVIQGGDQQGFPGNINLIGGGAIPGAQNIVSVQGGGVFVDGWGRYLRITNNLIQSNGGTYGGGIRLGTPNIAQPLTSNFNENIFIGYNRILANGGTNLAGAIGIFAGANNYMISNNDICGNNSIEYGGGISHYGYSAGGRIHHNRIYFNSSYDEGGGIMIAGELPADPALLSPGAGPVQIYQNLVQSNLANDDGGGIRFLMSGNFPSTVHNNVVVNNVSTHEGGGISLNDAPALTMYNNTIMMNQTTATAMTSNGQAAPAGLSTSRNSNLLQATLPAGSPIFSNPVLWNNLFWDNRAGSWDGNAVSGLGLPGDPSPINNWDLGVAGGAGVLATSFCLLQVPDGPGTNDIVGVNPAVVNPYVTTINVFPWRANANLVGAAIVAFDLPDEMIGDYHLTGGSPAVNTGTGSFNGVSARQRDFDNDLRPYGAGFDIGGDEWVGGGMGMLKGPITFRLYLPSTTRH